MDTEKAFLLNQRFVLLDNDEKRIGFDSVSNFLHLPATTIEKDWWVTSVLRAIYSLDYKNSIQFKGGTSLSKCWQLIERFSEDVDLVINKELLGFSGELTKSQISNKLRRAANAFSNGQFVEDLTKALIYIGIPENSFKIKPGEHSIPTQDPVEIFIEYDSVYPEDSYVSPKIKLEISGRSLNDALQIKYINSLFDYIVPNRHLTNKVFPVLTVRPERTFIEKVCLLHEEFNKTIGEPRYFRMSRHLYDLYMMSEKGIDKLVLENERLFISIVKHRFLYNRVNGVDYNTETPGFFNFIPTGKVYEKWEKDYNDMLSKMIYGSNKPSFKHIISRLEWINSFINEMKWSEIPIFTPGKNESQQKEEGQQESLPNRRGLKL